MIKLFKSFAPKNKALEMIAKTIDSGFMAEGTQVKLFEEKLAYFYGIDEIMATNSCTSAITIALRCAGIGSGDEVITTPLTCVATNMPIIQLGGLIKWADVNKSDGMINPESVKALINKKTKAILVLHKEGDLCEINKIREIAYEYKVPIIEDCAHVWRTENNGERIPSNSDFACFSYQAIKHINTGDGGSLYCQQKYREQARKFKWFGIDREKRRKVASWEEDIFLDGYKMNMNDITASLGIAQLEAMPLKLELNYRNGKLYDEIFEKYNPEIMTTTKRQNYRSSYWAYPIKVENRNELISILKSNNVEARQIHPRNDTLSVFKNFKSSNLEGLNFFNERDLSLPCGWWVSEEEINTIAELVLKFSKNCLR